MDVVVRIPDMQAVTSVTLPYFQMGRKRSFFSSDVGFPSGSDGKESTCNAEDLGSIPGLERSLGEGNGNPLQYSCLENPMDRGAWQTKAYGVIKSQTQLSDQHFTSVDKKPVPEDTEA